MKLFKVLTISLPLLLTACAEQSSRSIESQLEAAGFGLQGGELVTKATDSVTPQVKDVLALIHQQGFKPNCGGVQISNELVLTAAHCLVDLKTTSGWVPFKNLKVATCIDKDSEGCDWTPVKSVIIHEEFYLSKTKDKKLFESSIKGNSPISSTAFDIAILLLSRGSRTQQFVSIASKTPEIGDELFVYGSGITQLGKDLDHTIKTATFTADRISNYTKDRAELPGSYLALHSSEKGICPGDSGGPIFHIQDSQLVLSAISSRNMRRDGNYACGAWSTMVVDLSHHADWIKVKSEQLLQQSPRQAQNKK